MSVGPRAAGEGGAVRWMAVPSAEVTEQIVAVKTQSLLSSATTKDRALTRSAPAEGMSEGPRKGPCWHQLGGK